jgi:hypothetical protein
MKFYGNGIIWDSVKNKALCNFEKGILETEDSYICDRLKELDYKHDEVIVKEVIKQVEKPKAKRKR